MKWRPLLGMALAILVAIGCESEESQADKARTEREQRASQRAENNRRQFGHNGVIKGRVTFPSGDPALGVFVRARFFMRRTGASGEGEAMTGPDGSYEIFGLDEQDFMVQPQNDSAPIVAPAGRRVRVKGTVTGIDFVVEEGPWLNVRLLDGETGDPIPGIPVHASILGDYPQVEVGRTDARGELKIQFRTTRASVSIQPSGGGNDTVEAPGHPFWREFKLKPSSKTEWIVKAYRGGLYKEGTFRGRVVDESGRPVVGATVTMYRFEPSVVISDAQGRFSFRARRLTRHGEAEGGRKLAIRAEKDGAFGEVYPTAEETWSELKVTIKRTVRPSIVGQVIDFDGHPQGLVPICYYEWMSNVGSLGPSDGGFTDAHGRFEIHNLSPGAKYRLRFGGWPQYRGGKRGYGVVSLPLPNWGQIQLKPGERYDLGRVMVPLADQEVSGIVVNSEGKPAAGPLLIVVRGSYTSESMSPDRSGAFQIDGLVREGLALYVFRGDGNGFRTSDDSQDQVYKGPVQAGAHDLRIVIPDPTRKR